MTKEKVIVVLEKMIEDKVESCRGRGDDFIEIRALRLAVQGLRRKFNSTDMLIGILMGLAAAFWLFVMFF